MRIQLIVSCFLLLACVDQTQAQAPVLIVTEDLPPLQIDKEGRLYDGLAYQKVKRLVNTAKLDATWLVAPWARAYNIALSTPNVLLFSVVRTPKREEKFTWIGQLFLMDLFLVSLHSRRIKATTLEQAKHLLIATKRSDVVLNYLEAEGFVTGKNMMVVRDTKATYDALLKGRVDLVPANKIMIDSYCAKANCSLQDFNFSISLPDMEQDFYLAVSKGSDPEVINALRQAYQLHEASEAKEAKAVIEAVEASK